MKRVVFGLLWVIGSFGCGSARAPLSIEEDELISDAVHNGGDPLFYFLPPVVRSAPYTGLLDRAQRPVVFVDQIDPRTGAVLSNVRRFTDQGRDAERVRSAVDGWSVRWRPANDNTDPSATYRVAIFTGTRLRGFYDLQIADPLIDVLIRFRIEGGSAPRPRDRDRDGIDDRDDNCPTMANSDQIDVDRNGIGDACECSGTSCTVLTCYQMSTCDSTNGMCVDSSPVNCDDRDSCTEDRCDPKSGCVHRQLPQCSYSGRPCRSDAFFAELQDDSHALLNWDNAVMLPSANTALEALANAPGFPWFCGPDAITCPMGQVEARVFPLLPERASPTFRADAHKRFYRMFLTERTTGRRLAVRPSQQCSVVGAFQAAMAPMNRNRFASFGRECDGQALGVDGQPSAEMSNWHLERLGIDPLSVTLAPPAAGADLVDAALIDTGVVDPVATGIGVLLPEEEFVEGDHHKHGTGMSLLLRELAPNARIRSYRTLDVNGASTSAHLARAIDSALFGSGSALDRPLVINLSMGWPAELSQTSLLTGPACAVNEGPLGEAVRAMLRMARTVDSSTDPLVHRPVFVVAAAGNMPALQDAGLFPPADPALDGANVSHCVNQPMLIGEPWFLPAGWNRVLSCDGLPLGVTGAFGVSANDDADRSSVLSIPGADAPLVAPGEHVYVDFPGAPPTDLNPACTATASAVTFPAVFSGSSVASALVAGAALRAQHARVAAGLAPLSWDALARLLYATGETVCDAGTPRPTTTVPGMNIVRRLHVGRLDRSLTESACAAFVACASTSAGPVLSACAAELAACGLDTGCAAAHSPIGWPMGYVSPICPAGGAFSDELGTFDTAACSATPAGCYGAAPYRTLLGTLGPLPTDPGCLDCLAVRSAISPTKVNLFLQLNPAFPSGTTFTNKYVQFVAPSAVMPGSMITYAAPLDNPAFDGLWVPGASLSLFASAPLAFDFAKTQATLITTINDPIAKTSGIDYSALRVIAAP